MAEVLGFLCPRKLIFLVDQKNPHAGKTGCADFLLIRQSSFCMHTKLCHAVTLGQQVLCGNIIGDERVDVFATQSTQNGTAFFKTTGNAYNLGCSMQGSQTGANDASVQLYLEDLSIDIEVMGADMTHSATAAQIFDFFFAQISEPGLTGGKRGFE